MKIFSVIIIAVALCLSFIAIYIGLGAQLPGRALLSLIKLRDFFETALPVEGHHLRVDLLNAVVVEMTEVSFQKLTKDLDGFGRRKQVDVEMSNGPGRCGNFAPSP